VRGYKKEVMARASNFK